MFNSAVAQTDAPPPLEECRFDPRHLMKVGRTFFYSRVNDDGEEFGEIFACSAREADLLSRNLHKGHYRQKGVGDGKAFADYIKNCGVRAGSFILVSKAAEILKAAWDAEYKAARGKKMAARNDKIHRFIDPGMLKAPNGMAAARDFIGGDVTQENLINLKEPEA